jgi:outer membrane cobalamin receptor
VDLAAGYELTSHWALIARVTNAFNRHYQNPEAFDEPTIGAFAGIRTNF